MKSNELKIARKCKKCANDCEVAVAGEIYHCPQFTRAKK